MHQNFAHLGTALLVLTLVGCAAAADAPPSPTISVDRDTVFLKEAHSISTALTSDDRALISAGTAFCGYLDAGKTMLEIDGTVSLKTPISSMIGMRSAAADVYCPKYKDAVTAWVKKEKDYLNGASTGG